MQNQDIKYSFRNLQPIAYLKNFNQMIEHNSKHPLKVSSRGELKTVSLSKFPLPPYYQDMQGIFQSMTRLKGESGGSKHSSRHLQEQQFMRKHNEFMRKVLTKFIMHNESKEKLYQKQKHFIKKSQDIKNHVRSWSEPKLERIKSIKEIQIVHSVPSSEIALATKGSTIVVQEEQKEEAKSCLPVLRPRPKKQKLTLRSEGKVEEYVLSRKLTSHTHASKPVAKNRKKSEEKADFKEQIVNLQMRQARQQQAFAEKVEKQIAEFDKKMDYQVHAIKYYNFWKEPQKGEATLSSPKPRQEKQLSQGRADLAITIRNYVST